MLKYLLIPTCAILTLTGSVQANITNGDFSQSFNVGWTAEGDVIRFNEAAYFVEYEDYAEVSDNVGYFFYLDDSGNPPQYNPDYTEIIGNTVILDVSSLAGQEDLLLKYEFISDGGDNLPNQVILDDVALGVIPAPGALMLAGIGLGCFGVFRRRRAL